MMNLSAMKRGAAVKSLACREGELVQPGMPLLELE
jgi:hypothetical protein